MKGVNTEQAQKLDNALGFVENCGSLSDGVRRLLEEGPETKVKGLHQFMHPLDKFGSGERI